MKVTQVIGREEDYRGRIRDYIDLTSDDLARRIWRGRTECGRHLKVSLPRNHHLRHGDVLLDDGETIVIVRVLPEWILAIYPATFAQMVETGHQLGNRHLPIQLTESEVLVQYHPLLEETIQKLGIRCERVLCRVERPFLNLFAPHSH